MIPHRTGWLYQLTEFESKGALGATSAQMFEMRIRKNACPVSVVLSLPGEDPRIVSGPLHLHQPLRLDGVRRPAGTKVDIDAVFSADNCAEVMAISLGPSDDMVPPLRAIISNQPLEPGRAYRMVQTAASEDAQPIYANLACMAPETLLLTGNGTRAIKDIRPRDQVFTLDHGMRSVLGIGRRKMARDASQVRIKHGALGNNRDLILSPHHRVIVQDQASAKYFGEPEVLVPASQLVDGHRIVSEPCTVAAFYYILFEGHEIVMAEGLQIETTLISSDTSMVGAGAEDLMQVMPGFVTTAPRRMTAARAVSL